MATALSSVPPTAPSGGITYRPGQQAAIDQICAAWESGKKTVVLDAPVGAGKSLILATVGRRFWESHGWRAYYSTPLVSLVNQLANDPLVGPFVPVIMGRRNYPCPIDPEQKRSADDAYCVDGAPCLACKGTGRDAGGKCPACRRGKISAKKYRCVAKADGDCPYFAAKGVALTASLSGSTLSYLLSVVDPTSLESEEDAYGDTQPDIEVDQSFFKFTARDCLFLDEAHNLDNAGLQHLAFTLSQRTSPSETWAKFWRTQVTPVLYAAPELQTREQIQGLMLQARTALRECMELVSNSEEAAEGDTEQTRYAREARRLHRLAYKVQQVLDTPEEPWLLTEREERSGTGLECAPVMARGFLKRFLWKLAPYRVLASGTFGDIGQYLGEVGLDPADVAVVTMPSFFPPANAPIFLQFTAPLSRDSEPTSMPLILDALQTIFDKEPDRGLLHVPSYALARKIYEGVPDVYRDRIWTHEGSDRNVRLQKWLEDKTPGTVFLGVQMTDGLDLMEERARWQVIIKTPYPDLGDARVKARREMADGNAWYEAKTKRSLLQALGRVVRSPTDIGRTYVLDSHACRLLTYNVPRWVSSRVAVGSTILNAGRKKPWER
jgi:Rad3-related DNA helicase